MLFPGILFADDLSKFAYDLDKIETGILYQYVKSNHDGSNPENIAVYVAAADRLEVFKYHEPGTRAGFVIAWMDWSIFSAPKLESYQVLSATEVKKVATLDYSKDSKTITTRLLMADAPAETVKVEHVPFHVYNFDFTSLNFTFRHLKDPKESFTIEVPDLVYRNNEWHLVNHGSATVRYVGQQQIHGKPCVKYSIDGDGLENRGGFIWIHAEKGHAERMEINLPDNPDWDNFLLDLKEVRELTAEEWKDFRLHHFQK